MRYFTAHGPASIQDFAWWAGITLTEARVGLEEVKHQLHSEQTDGSQYWMSQDATVAGGEVIGTWKRTIKKKEVEVVVTPFEPIRDREETVIMAAERYAEFMGLPLKK